jgi:acyl carrier protein
MTKPILNKKPNVENAVFTFIHSIIPDCKIHPLMDFFIDLQFDSLERIELLLYLEETFAIAIEDDTIYQKVSQVGPFINEIKRKYSLD